MTDRELLKTAPRINGWAVAGLALGMAVWPFGLGVFLSSLVLQQPAVVLILQLLASAAVLMMSVVGNRRSYLVDQNRRYIYSYDRGRNISIIGMIINSLYVLIVLFLATGYVVDSHFRRVVDPLGFCGFAPEWLLKGPICEFLWMAESVWGGLMFAVGTLSS